MSRSADSIATVEASTSVRSTSRKAPIRLLPKTGFMRDWQPKEVEGRFLSAPLHTNPCGVLSSTTTAGLLHADETRRGRIRDCMSCHKSFVTTGETRSLAALHDSAAAAAEQMKESSRLIAGAPDTVMLTVSNISRVPLDDDKLGYF